MRNRITRALRKQVFDEANWKCEYCGTKLDESNSAIDHKHPRSKGGSDSRENLAAACRMCNAKKSDKLFDEFSAPIAKKAAMAWVHAYIKSPKLTSILSVILTVVGMIFAVYSNQKIEFQREESIAKNLNFKTQIEQLDKTEDSLKQLLTFIEIQKNQVAENQRSLEILVEEQTKLEPLVNADKKVVEALLSVQQLKAKELATNEKVFGFISGVIASILASIVIIIVQYFFRVRRESL
ncbi:HNH endonuclease signature motif containing protein [Pseudoalteromonas sp. MMG007]|uniref:HNH endonuclease n=1 Tax=Pseudoalteromonas sp. MMG007 TaxID=2822684 RepID=UPI001B379DC0|nr:HNH endonuclease signature motif containing protein [Pseudoalteromonas sp. MMG007]MBQ4857356.1 HNH endonuclease [Pseudoalteromonas sp. MMG007]